MTTPSPSPLFVPSFAVYPPTHPTTGSIGRPKAVVVPPSLPSWYEQTVACLLAWAALSPSLPPAKRRSFSQTPSFSFCRSFSPFPHCLPFPLLVFLFSRRPSILFLPFKAHLTSPLPFACSLRRFGLERGKTGLPHIRPPFRYPPQFERGRSAGGSAAVAAFQVSSLPPLPTFFFLPPPAPSPGLSVCGREEEGRRGIRRGREGKGGGVGIRNRLVRGSPEHKKSFAKVESGMRVVGQR